MVRQAARMIQELYGEPGFAGLIEHRDETNGIVWAARRLDLGTLIAFRGSRAPVDWLRDLDGVVGDSRIPGAWPGFTIGMIEAIREITAMFPPPFIACGHSLGASRAAVFHRAMPDRVARVIGFGQPRWSVDPPALPRDGAEIFANRVNDLYFDPVPDVPPLHHASADPIIVSAEPDERRKLLWGPFAPHWMGCYLAAVEHL